MRSEVDIKVLRFVNRFEDYDEPEVTEIRLAADQDVKDIMIWYGSHFSGDPYEVFLNGRQLAIDLNGWLEPKVIDGQVMRPMIEVK